jgi:NAD+ diphosphatase
MPYPETINLPFNRSALPGGFVLHPTPQTRDSHPARWIVLQGPNLVLCEQGELLQPPQGALPSELLLTFPPLAFASWQGQQLLVTAISSQTTLPEGLVAEPFNALRERIPAELMTIAGIGKQLLHWQQMSRFCSRCGGQPHQLADSWGKKCPDCGYEHFPHIHPCAIVLIRRDDQLLLIRKPEWAAGRYGLVAGFLDVGESLEECAIRETREETGIEIKNVRYVISQCWPFPSQLMAGFVADYSGGSIQVDGNEVEDARWFTIGSLPNLPAQRSIARFLIDSCADIS